MTGLAAHPESTLSDRALDRLAGGACSAHVLTREVLGLPNASPAVAERLVVALLGADPRVRQLPEGDWALAPAAQGSPLLEDCAFAVVDVETTGSRAGGDDRIIEIAVVTVQGSRIETALDTLVHPGRSIPWGVTSVTGITDETVRQAPPFEAVADQVLAALAGRVFVAHNARFDWGFVSGELRRSRGLVLGGPRLCTVRLSRRLVRDVQSCSLDSLSLRFNLDNPARHRAAGDALTTARLLQRLLPLAREADVRTLQELETLSAKRVKAGRARAAPLELLDE